VPLLAQQAVLQQPVSALTEALLLAKQWHTTSVRPVRVSQQPSDTVYLSSSKNSLSVNPARRIWLRNKKGASAR
jgi:hypothetical protein